VDKTVIQAYPSPLIEAIEANFDGRVAFVPGLVKGPRVWDQNDLIRVDSLLHSDAFNKILHARLDETDADTRIDEALAAFHAVDRPFAWRVGPCSRPLDLERRLAERGLQPAGQEIGWTLELKDLPLDVEPPPGFEIREVTQLTDLNGFATVLAQEAGSGSDDVLAYYERAAPFLLKGDGPLRLFVAYGQDEPAAVGELFLSRLGDAPRGLAGIRLVAGDGTYRRPSLDLALTWTALDAARKLGARTAALMSAPQDQAIYGELGFQACCRFVDYTP